MFDSSIEWHGCLKAIISLTASARYGAISGPAVKLYAYVHLSSDNIVTCLGNNGSVDTSTDMAHSQQL